MDAKTVDQLCQQAFAENGLQVLKVNLNYYWAFMYIHQTCVKRCVSYAKEESMKYLLVCLLLTFAGMVHGQNFKSVSYTQLIPMLIGSVKELTAKISSLEEEINFLKNKK